MDSQIQESIINLQRITIKDSNESDSKSLSRSSSFDMNQVRKALGSLTAGLEESSANFNKGFNKKENLFSIRERNLAQT